jgi:hypothetical protein
MCESIRKTAGAGARRFGLAAALAVAAAGLAPGAHAAEPAPSARVVKDPVSGELRAPTAAEAAALEAAGKSLKAQRQAPARGMLTGRVNPGQIKYPDGTVQQELDETSLAHTVMTRNADGTLEMVCVTGPEAVEAALKAKTSAQGKTTKTNQEHNHDAK